MRLSRDHWSAYFLKPKGTIYTELKHTFSVRDSTSANSMVDGPFIIYAGIGSKGKTKSENFLI